MVCCTCGFRKGCLLSPTLLNMSLEFVMQESESMSDQFLLTYENLTTNVKYADDTTTLISLIFEKLELATNELHQVCNKWELKTNTDKCKVMTHQDQNVGLGSEPIENLNKFIFLGSFIPGSGLDVDRRIGIVSSAFGRLRELSFQIKKYKLKLK